MTKFYRKHEEIEAQQFNSKSLDRPPGVTGHGDGRWFIVINGSEIDVFDGDWITYSEHGVGVCRDSYFCRIYEPVDDRCWEKQRTAAPAVRGAREGSGDE